MDWTAAIARAESLGAKIRPAAALMDFARAVLRYQQEIYRRAGSPGRKDPQKLDTALLAGYVPDFLQLLEKHAPPPLAVQAQKFQDRQDWEVVLRACWQQAHDPLDPIARLILQPYVQYLCERWRVEVGMPDEGDGSCPFCSRAPLLSIDAGRRLLLCSLCSNEWSFPERRCPGCQAGKIRLTRSRQLPHVRLEACESCGHYLKSVDLRREPAAVPIVDEIAAAELDRAARDEGLLKFEPNLAGL